MKYLLLTLPLFIASCAGVPRIYIEADRSTFEAIAPEYEAYVDADDTLDAKQKERRKRTVETWNKRIAAAEEGLGE